MIISKPCSEEPWDCSVLNVRISNGKHIFLISLDMCLKLGEFSHLVWGNEEATHHLKLWTNFVCIRGPWLRVLIADVQISSAKKLNGFFQDTMYEISDYITSG